MNLPRKLLVVVICAVVICTSSARPRGKSFNSYRKSRKQPRVQPQNVVAPYKTRRRPAPKRRYVQRQALSKGAPKISRPIAPLNKNLLRENPIDRYNVMVINDVEELLAHNKMTYAWQYLKSSDSILPKNSSQNILEEIITKAKKLKDDHIRDYLVNLSLSAPTSQDMNIIMRIMMNKPEVFGQDFYMLIAKSSKLTSGCTKDLDLDIQFHLLRHALQKNDLFAIQNLLESGIDPNAQDNNWVNKMYWKSLMHPDVYAASRPIEFAIDTNNPALVSLLLDYGATLDPVTDILNPHENSMLQRAIRRGRLTNNLTNSKKIISLLVQRTGWVSTCYAKNMIFITKEEPTKDKLQNFYAQYETNKLESVFQVRSDLIAIAPEVKFSVK